MAVADSMRLSVIEPVESRGPHYARVHPRQWAIAWPTLRPVDDPVIQAIERFRCAKGPLSAERRNRGYTIYTADTGTPVARLRQAGAHGNFEVLYWSLWKERWTSTGPFGRTVLPIEDALRFIAYEDIFWTMT